MPESLSLPPARTVSLAPVSPLLQDLDWIRGFKALIDTLVTLARELRDNKDIPGYPEGLTLRDFYAHSGFLRCHLGRVVQDNLSREIVVCAPDRNVHMGYQMACGMMDVVVERTLPGKIPIPIKSLESIKTILSRVTCDTDVVPPAVESSQQPKTPVKKDPKPAAGMSKDEESAILNEYVRSAQSPTLRGAAKKLGKSNGYVQKHPVWRTHMGKRKALSGLSVDIPATPEVRAKIRSGEIDPTQKSEILSRLESRFIEQATPSERIRFWMMPAEAQIKMLSLFSDQVSDDAQRHVDRERLIAPGAEGFVREVPARDSALVEEPDEFDEGEDFYQGEAEPGATTTGRNDARVECGARTLSEKLLDDAVGCRSSATKVARLSHGIRRSKERA